MQDTHLKDEPPKSESQEPKSCDEPQNRHVNVRRNGGTADKSPPLASSATISTKHMSTWLRLGIVVVLAGTTTWVGKAATNHYLPSNRTLPGLSVAGEVIPDDVAGDPATLERWLDAKVEAQVGARAVNVIIGDKDDPASPKRVIRLRDVAVRPDVKILAATIRDFGRYGNVIDRLQIALRARRGAISFSLPIAIDPRTIEDVVVATKAEVDRPAIDGKLDLEGHRVIPDTEGRLLDVEGSVAQITAALAAVAAGGSSLPVEGEMYRLVLSPVRLPARTTGASLSALDIHEVVSSFETHFSRAGDQAARATNIEVAAKKLDGLVLRAGELVSFNQIVGERSEANGFKTAWEIFKGEMRPGIGGGTCQVASTIHAAAFFGGFEIRERLPHSRPSAYIPMGLDSTVVWPVVDLKLRNPHPFTIVVHTIVKGNTLKVELLGKEKPGVVTFTREVVDTFPYERRLDEDAGLAPGKAVKKQGGIRGYRVRRVRTVKTTGSATPVVETTFDFYPPTTEIYLVAPGTDPRDLPALPDDVKEGLAKKRKLPVDDDAVACAGDCDGESPRTPVDVKNGAGVHDPVGDQAHPGRSISIAR